MTMPGFAGGSGGFGQAFGETNFWDAVVQIGGALLRGGNGNGVGFDPNAPPGQRFMGGERNRFLLGDPGGAAACAPRPRLASAVIVNNPCTGAPHVYKNMGAISSGLFSGDFRAHKRVNKLAAKAARGRSRRKRR